MEEEADKIITVVGVGGGGKNPTLEGGVEGWGGQSPAGGGGGGT